MATRQSENSPDPEEASDWTDAVLPESLSLCSSTTESDDQELLEETDDASAASDVEQLDDTEKADCEFFWSFLACPEKELDAMMRFLASLRTVCKLRLEGRYLPDGKLEAQHEVLLREKFPSYKCPVKCLGRHTVLIIAAKSSETTDQIRQHLSPCISYICSLADQSEMDTFDVPLYDQLQKSLDSMLQTLLHLWPGFATLDLVIMKALMPCINSESVRMRRCAMERIATLSKVLVPAFLMEEEIRDDDFFLEKKSEIFLGQLLGHLTLCYAEEDEDIRHGSLEVLHAIHRTLAVHHGYEFRYGKPKLNTEEGSWDHFCPVYAVANTLVVGSLLSPTEKGNFILTVLEGMTHPKVSNIEVVANTCNEVLTDKSSWILVMPQIVQSICYHLESDITESLRDIVIRTLLQITRSHPQCIVRTMLRDIPWCNRSFTIVWQTVASESSLAVVTVNSLLKEWPHSGHDSIASGHSCTTHLTIRHAMHTILHLPSTKGCALLLMRKLYGPLLFEVSFALQCSQSGCFNLDRNTTNNASCANDIRFAVENVKALFHHLMDDSVVEDIGKQGGWNMLMNLETYHKGVAVLTRALANMGSHCCAMVLEETLITLCQRREHSEVGAMAVFTELLDCVGITEITDYVRRSSILSLLQSHLQNQNSVMRELAATSLIKLSALHTLAVALQDLLPGITQQLQDAPCDTGAAAMTVLHNMLPQSDKQRMASIALQLPELLVPFFLNESGRIRQLSILLCKDAMEMAKGICTWNMKKEVRNILLPLFFHLHDQDQSVAQASQEALLCAAKLLKQRRLQHLLKNKQLQSIGECLLASYCSRADQFLEQSLLYLQSLQETLRLEAVRFIGEPRG
ncbi:maestro heat-like repeat-containing protein family member 7 [Coturnix japonica]|uniref:Maestro heat-like repeat-containing protein family member 7 n=1 Tax=Coturnix japonica TaxID=93934 RepID=A0A8C2STR4_COTJA|nr:maestro heat-like repeat-containing protein family member 7 [Coturnix japonica]